MAKKTLPEDSKMFTLMLSTDDRRLLHELVNELHGGTGRRTARVIRLAIRRLHKETFEFSRKREAVSGRGQGIQGRARAERSA